MTRPNKPNRNMNMNKITKTIMNPLSPGSISFGGVINLILPVNLSLLDVVLISLVVAFVIIFDVAKEIFELFILLIKNCRLIVNKFVLF